MDTCEMKIKIKISYLYILLCTVLLTAACSSKKEAELETPMEASLSLCLPAGDFLSVNPNNQRRIMGDPGQTEMFTLPRYVYIFLLRQRGNQWTVYERIEDVLEVDQWEKLRYHGRLQTENDSIFRYKRAIKYMLTSDRFNGRVYAVMSAKQLRFETSLSSVETLDDVLNLRFDASPDSIQRNVQHIYTSPYNYEVDGEYYGSFSSIGNNHPTVNLMLYHVAAKVDLKWNVADSVRIKSNPAQAVRLTSMSVRGLYNGWSYLFRPMENTVTTIPVSGYEISDVVTPADEGLWWEGRYYFYTIPYRVNNSDYFPLQLVMRTNELAGDGYQLTVNQPFNAASPFVPWLRADLRLTRPLKNEAATITIAE